MQVRDVMTWGVECVDPDASLSTVAERMRVLDVGAMPVCDHGRLTGVVTDRDIVVRSTSRGRNPLEDRVRDVMTPGVHYCFEDHDVAIAAQIMREKQVRRLAVLARDKQLLGILSLGDIAVEVGDESLAGRALEGISDVPAV